MKIYGGNFKKIIPKKAPMIKEYLLTAIRESWNHFDKGYYFKLVKSLAERIKAVIKAQRGVTNSIFLSMNYIFSQYWVIP